jgi:hypothetical protein
MGRGLAADEALRVRLASGLVGVVNAAASQEARNRFAERVMKVSSDDQKQDFLFRVMAKRLGPGAAQEARNANSRRPGAGKSVSIDLAVMYEAQLASVSDFCVPALSAKNRPTRKL